MHRKYVYIVAANIFVMDNIVPRLSTLYIIGEEAKNKHALKICRRIMRDATWINIHTLPVRKIKMDTFKGEGEGGVGIVVSFYSKSSR